MNCEHRTVFRICWLVHYSKKSPDKRRRPPKLYERCVNFNVTAAELILGTGEPGTQRPRPNIINCRPVHGGVER